MPDIKIKQEIEYEVNIDVYCGTCETRMSSLFEEASNCI